MNSDSYQIFTSDAGLGNASHILRYFTKFEKFLKIQPKNFHLHSISGCQVKKFEMFLWRWSIHEMAHFWAFLGPNSPKYGPILLKFAPQLVFMGSKTVFFENSNFYRNRTYPKFALFSVFVQLWGCFSPWRRPKSKKLNVLQDQTTPSGYPKITKSRPYLVPIFQEKYDYFCPILVVFWWKKGRAWSHFKGSESKFDLPYCSITIVGHVSVQKVWFQHFPVLRL